MKSIGDNKIEHAVLFKKQGDDAEQLDTIKSNARLTFSMKTAEKIRNERKSESLLNSNLSTVEATAELSSQDMNRREENVAPCRSDELRDARDVERTEGVSDSLDLANATSTAKYSGSHDLSEQSSKFVEREESGIFILLCYVGGISNTQSVIAVD